MADFHNRAMDERIGDNGAEKGRFELLSLLEILGPFAARPRESEVGARGHCPGCLEHRGDLCHEPHLRRRDRIRFRSRPTQHVMQETSLLAG